ncbi:VOC family protein [Micromonospora sp. NPDC049101]|uniref:VOC family protein n=1 Tax=unclassified Micromonospora TaxID=2617518 RepID=UPI0033F0FFA1
MTTQFSRPPGSATLMHVAISCPDVDESLRFYREGLGFSRTYEWTRTFTETGQVVYCGRGVYIELGGHTYVELFPGGRRDVDSSAGPLQHIALIVPSVDEAYRNCLGAGGAAFPFDQWSGEPTTVTINGSPEMLVRVAFVKGPAGELIELYEQYSPVVTK